MVSLYSLIIFFFILVVFYSAVSLVLSISGWLQKRWAVRKKIPPQDVSGAIDARTDRLKSKAFPITVSLVLFCITPFVVLYLILYG